MPPLAGQRRLNAPPVDGPASVPQPPQHTNPPRSFPAPARPCQTEAKFPRGAGGGCSGKALHRGEPGRPHLPPVQPPPAATGPSLLPRPPTPCNFRVRICATCGQPQPRAPLTRPADRARFLGSVPGSVPPGRSWPDPDALEGFLPWLRRGMRPLGWGRRGISGDPGPRTRVRGGQGNFVDVYTALGPGLSGSGPLPPPPNLPKPELALATARAGSGLPVAGAGIAGLPLSARRKLLVRTSSGLLGTLVGFSAVAQNSLSGF